MTLRKYHPEDCGAAAELFYQTVHTVNARDYTRAQLDAWAPARMDLEAWNQSLLAHTCLVAEEDGRVIGFADMDAAGYLDRLYVHRDHQGEGVASALCDALEETVSGPVTTHASITAKTFFEKRGYRVVREQTVVRWGVALGNFVMVKER